MDLTMIKKLPSAEEIIQAFPLSESGHLQVERDRAEICNIIAGKDKRLLLVVGPCSAWPYQACLEYASRLKKLSQEVQDKLKLVMRLYIQKPRTTRGWTGPVNQPNPFVPPDVEEGIKYCRGLMVKIIEMGLPIADEAVFTHNAKGFIELLSWVAIGARSVEDQEHRVFASAVGFPTGMKNNTSGSIDVAVNGIIAAQFPHIAVFNGYQVETNGNSYAHLVLRGGSNGPNYEVEHLRYAQGLLERDKVKNPAVLVDASHDNCKKDGKKDCGLQVQVVRSVLQSMKNHPDLRILVKGFMLESFLKKGSQKVEALTSESIDQDGLSITDPCLGWEETEALVREAAQAF